MAWDLQAFNAYIACVQYTLRDVPPNLDRVVRQKARQARKSLNQVLIDALLRAFGLTREPARQRDLSDVTGTWRDDPKFDEVVREQRRVDPELWR
jgi:hypothetical protein